jgi:RHS repeat-associated protein
VQTSVTNGGSTTYRTRVYDIFGQDVADYSGSSGGTLEREYIYRGGLLATYDAGTSTLNYVLQDIQGSTRATVSNNGSSSAITVRHDFLPFGEDIHAGVGLRTTGQGYDAADPNRQKYALTERDDTTGLDHTWWREHDKLSGRWTSPDPYKGSVSIVDPQSMNRFIYVENDPLNFMDSSGLDGEDPPPHEDSPGVCALGGCTVVVQKPPDDPIEDFNSFLIDSLGGGGGVSGIGGGAAGSLGAGALMAGAGAPQKNCATPNSLVEFFKSKFEALWKSTVESAHDGNGGEENGADVFYEQSTNTYPLVQFSQGVHLPYLGVSTPEMPKAYEETKAAINKFSEEGRVDYFMAFFHTHPDWAPGRPSNPDGDPEDMVFTRYFGNVLGIIRSSSGYRFYSGGQTFGPEDPRANECIVDLNHKS